MSSYFVNFTTFDIQFWPPPPKIDPKVFTEYTLNPSLFVPLLLVYHTFTSIVLQNFRDAYVAIPSYFILMCLTVETCLTFELELLSEKN